MRAFYLFQMPMADAAVQSVILRTPNAAAVRRG